MDDDGIGIPRCPVHLEAPRVAGHDPEGRGARWECVVPGWEWLQVS